MPFANWTTPPPSLGGGNTTSFAVFCSIAAQILVIIAPTPFVNSSSQLHADKKCVPHSFAFAQMTSALNAFFALRKY